MSTTQSGMISIVENEACQVIDDLNVTRGWLRRLTFPYLILFNGD